MSEVPQGVRLDAVTRRPPRPTATMTLTRDGPNGVEVLLGLRSATMAAFPQYWAFPGGGVSSVDKAAVEQLPALEGAESEAIACILREMAEELGLQPSQQGLVSIPPERRLKILHEKTAWLEGVLADEITVERNDILVLSHRITPPFGPIQFDNAFMHYHAGPAANVPEIDLEPQTEFTSMMWEQPSVILNRWRMHEIKVAPPVVTLLMEIERTLDRYNRDMNRAGHDISSRLPGRRSILFAHGVEVLPIKTHTLPPADHTNCYLVGDPEGDFIIVDPAVQLREDMEALAAAIERHHGNPIAVFLTHGHGDHLPDIGLLREAIDLPIWASEYTSEIIQCDRILHDGDLLELGHQTWKVLHTPGHDPGHLCLLGDAGLVAGDMVAGFGTILIPSTTGNMEIYLEQLQRLRSMEPHLIFPSHGPVIAQPTKVLTHYITHRTKRHERVMEALRRRYSTLEEIAIFAYSDTPDAHPGLAQDQTLAHLRSHEREGRAVLMDGRWKAKERE